MPNFCDGSASEILRTNGLEQRVATVVEAFRFPRFRPRKGVRSDERERDRGVRIAHDAVREIVRINLPPTHGFVGGCAGEAPCVGTRVRALEEVIVSALFDTHDLLDLRLCLKDEVLGRTAAEDEHTRGVPVGFGGVHNRRRLVHVAVHVELQF